MSNIFDKIASREHANDTKLGLPSTDRAHYDRRKHLMSVLSGGKGWHIPSKEPARRADGTTRGERKRALRAATNAKVSEARSKEFRHSSGAHVEYVTIRVAA